jgi:hypothetical protein
MDLSVGPAAVFVDWAHHDCGLRLSHEAIFTPANLERWIATAKLAPAVVKARRSAIQRIGRATTSRAGWPALQDEYSRTPRPIPYTKDELRQLDLQAATQPTHSKRRLNESVLALGLGVGASGRYASYVSPRDITVDDHGVHVKLVNPDRQVTVRRAYESRIKRLMIGLEPHERLLGPTSRLSSMLTTLTRDHDDVALNLARLRATYTFELLKDNAPLHIVLNALGLNCASALTAALPYLELPDVAAQAAILRGGST